MLHGTLPVKIQTAAGMIAGCVGGALQRSRYLSIIYRSGFEQLQLVKERVIELLNADELKQFGDSRGDQYNCHSKKPAISCDYGACCLFVHRFASVLLSARSRPRLGRGLPV